MQLGGALSRVISAVNYRLSTHLPETDCNYSVLSTGNQQGWGNPPIGGLTGDAVYETYLQAT